MPTFSKWIVTLNPKVLYRGLFRDLLAKVAKERERKRAIDRAKPAWCRARAHREKEREDKESARGAFCRSEIRRDTTRAFWMMMCARKCPVEMSPPYIYVRSRGVVDDERE